MHPVAQNSGNNSESANDNGTEETDQLEIEEAASSKTSEEQADTSDGDEGAVSQNNNGSSAAELGRAERENQEATRNGGPEDTDTDSQSSSGQNKELKENEEMCINKFNATNTDIRNTIQNTASSEESITGKKVEDTSEINTTHSPVPGSTSLLQSDVLQKYINEAVKKFISENPVVANVDPNVLMKSLDTGALIQSINSNTVDETAQNTAIGDGKKQRLYLPPPGIPEYNPTPILELKKRKSVEEQMKTDESQPYEPEQYSENLQKEDKEDTAAEFSTEEEYEDQQGKEFDLLEEVIAEKSQQNVEKYKSKEFKKRKRNLGKLINRSKNSKSIEVVSEDSIVAKADDLAENIKHDTVNNSDNNNLSSVNIRTDKSHLMVSGVAQLARKPRGASVVAKPAKTNKDSAAATATENTKEDLAGVLNPANDKEVIDETTADVASSKNSNEKLLDEQLVVKKEREEEDFVPTSGGSRKRKRSRERSSSREYYRKKKRKREKKEKRKRSRSKKKRRRNYSSQSDDYSSDVSTHSHDNKADGEVVSKGGIKQEPQEDQEGEAASPITENNTHEAKEDSNSDSDSRVSSNRHSRSSRKYKKHKYRKSRKKKHHRRRHYSSSSSYDSEDYSSDDDSSRGRRRGKNRRIPVDLSLVKQEKLEVIDLTIIKDEPESDDDPVPSSATNKTKAKYDEASDSKADVKEEITKQLELHRVSKSESGDHRTTGGSSSSVKTEDPENNESTACDMSDSKINISGIIPAGKLKFDLDFPMEDKSLFNSDDNTDDALFDHNEDSRHSTQSNENNTNSMFKTEKTTDPLSDFSEVSNTASGISNFDTLLADSTSITKSNKVNAKERLQEEESGKSLDDSSAAEHTPVATNISSSSVSDKSEAVKSSSTDNRSQSRSSSSSCKSKNSSSSSSHRSSHKTSSSSQHHSRSSSNSKTSSSNKKESSSLHRSNSDKKHGERTSSSKSDSKHSSSSRGRSSSHKGSSSKHGDSMSASSKSSSSSSTSKDHKHSSSSSSSKSKFSSDSKSSNSSSSRHHSSSGSSRRCSTDKGTTHDKNNSSKDKSAADRDKEGSSSQDKSISSTVKSSSTSNDKKSSNNKDSHHKLSLGASSRSPPSATQHFMSCELHGFAYECREWLVVSLFIYLFICWRCRMTALLLCCHFIAPCTT